MSGKDDHPDLKLLTEEEKDQKSRRERKRRHVAADYELDTLDNRIIQLMLDYPDIKRAKIAAICAVSKPAIYARLKKPAVIRALAELQRNGMDLIKDVQQVAVRRVRRLIHSTDEKIALDACKLVLMPMFNQATLQVNATQEKVFKVQFGDSGSMFLSEETSEQQKKMTPLEIIKMAKERDIPLSQALEGSRFYHEKEKDADA